MSPRTAMTENRRCRRRRSASDAVRAAIAVLAFALPSAARAAPCPAAVALADVSAPHSIVGNGTPASCTESALATAIAGGGVIVFACGAAPVTIAVTSTLNVTSDTVLDGGGLVTLDGGGTTRILAVPSSFELGTPTLTVQRLTFTRGSSAAVGGDDTERGGGAIWVRGGSLRVVSSHLHRQPRACDRPGRRGRRDLQRGRAAPSRSRRRTSTATAPPTAARSARSSRTSRSTARVIANNAASGSGGNPGNGGNGGGIYLDGNDQTRVAVRIDARRQHRQRLRRRPLPCFEQRRRPDEDRAQQRARATPFPIRRRAWRAGCICRASRSRCATPRSRGTRRVPPAASSSVRTGPASTQST